MASSGEEEELCRGDLSSPSDRESSGSDNAPNSPECVMPDILYAEGTVVVFWMELKEQCGGFCEETRTPRDSTGQDKAVVAKASGVNTMEVVKVDEMV